MQNEVKVFIELSDEIEEYIEKNGIDLKQSLDKSEIASEIQNSPNPFEPESGIKKRDWLLTLSIIIGSAYSAKMILPEINELIKTILGRDVIIYQKQVPIKDEKTGEYIKNNMGELVLVDQDAHEQAKTQNKTETAFEILKAKLSFKTEDNSPTEDSK